MKNRIVSIILCSLVFAPFTFAKQKKKQNKLAIATKNSKQKTKKKHQNLSALILGNETKTSKGEAFEQYPCKFTDTSKGEEFLRHIISYLDIKSLGNLRAAAKGFNACIDDQWDEQLKNLAKKVCSHELENYFVKASTHGFYKVVRLLLNIQDTEKSMRFCYQTFDRAFVEAASQGHKKILERLLTSQTITRKNVNDSFVAAAKNGHIEAVTFLTTNTQTSNTLTARAFLCAAENGRKQIVEFFIATFDITSKAINYALAKAAKKRHTQIVAYLLTHPSAQEKIDGHGINETLRFINSIKIHYIIFIWMWHKNLYTFNNKK